MNTTAPTPQNDDRLGRALGYSAAFHVAVFIALAVRAVFLPSAPMDLQDSIRVDMVALPDKSPAKLPQAAAAPEPAAPAKVEEVKPAPAPEPAKAEPLKVAKPEAPKVDLNSAKKSQEAAMRRLEAMQKIERMARAQEAKQSAEHAAKLAAAIGNAPTAPIKGNVIASGTSLTGIARQEFRTYLSNVRDQVRSHWNLPPYLRGTSLVARVRIFIDSKGFVVKREIVKSSGNPVFDERVELALDAASPLPPPPAELSDVLSVDGAELDFSPE